MNRSLLVFSILLILMGIGLGQDFIAVFGFFLLLPALFSTPRPRPQGTPTGSGQQAPEPAPGPAPVMETAPEPASFLETASRSVAQQTVAPTSMPPPPPSQPSFSAPLFPTCIFPGASQQIQTAQAPEDARTKGPDSKDDVLELGALLALVKLVFG